MKTIWKPTEEELVEIGFEVHKFANPVEGIGDRNYQLWISEDGEHEGVIINSNHDSSSWYVGISDSYEHASKDIYPQSKQDIETLIRLFSKI